MPDGSRTVAYPACWHPDGWRTHTKATTSPAPASPGALASIAVCHPTSPCGGRSWRWARMHRLRMP